MSRFRKVVAMVLAVFVAGLAVENAVSMACPMEKSERCACCDEKAARISDDANECCSVLTVERRAVVPAELSPVPNRVAPQLSIPSVFLALLSMSDSPTLIGARALAPPGVPAFLANLSIRC
jgi:hypothetical protein